MKRGTLYLIPVPLGDIAPELVIPQGTLQVMKGLRSFVVEELRSARRYLSAVGFKGEVDSLSLYTLNEHTKNEEVESIVELLCSGESLGVISEAGLPAVADPGSNLVMLSHLKGIVVVPLTGPSSLMLALMASGKNGQSFSFNGYLPVKSDERRSKIRELERVALKTGQSQIIIETPYRNDALLADFLLVCNEETTLTIAAEVTTANEFIATKTIKEWRVIKPLLKKRPCVFIL